MFVTCTGLSLTLLHITISRNLKINCFYNNPQKIKFDFTDFLKIKNTSKFISYISSINY